MGTKTVRFDEKLENMLKEIEEYYDCDSSKAIKKAVVELYEDVIDNKFVKEYEKKLRKKEVAFYTHEEVIEKLNEQN